MKSIHTLTRLGRSLAAAFAADHRGASSRIGQSRAAGLGFMPLEPRILFDGAAVATAVDASHTLADAAAPVAPVEVRAADPS